MHEKLECDDDKYPVAQNNDTSANEMTQDNGYFTSQKNQLEKESDQEQENVAPFIKVIKHETNSESETIYELLH